MILSIGLIYPAAAVKIEVRWAKEGPGIIERERSKPGVEIFFSVDFTQLNEEMIFGIFEMLRIDYDGIKRLDLHDKQLAKLKNNGCERVFAGMAKLKYAAFAIIDLSNNHWDEVDPQIFSRCFSYTQTINKTIQFIIAC